MERVREQLRVTQALAWERIESSYEVMGDPFEEVCSKVNLMFVELAISATVTEAGLEGREIVLMVKAVDLSPSPCRLTALT